MRARKIALPALVEREGMPTTEPGDLRWIVAMLNWAWSMVRKDPLNDLAVTLAWGWCCKGGHRTIL